MNPSRRTFLQGIMILVGTLAIGLSPSKVGENFLAEGGESAKARPTGDCGSVRIDNQWYALHRAEVKPYTLIAENNGDNAIIISSPSPVGWTVHCTIDQDRELVQRLYTVKWHEIGFMLAGYSVTGIVRLIEDHPVHVREDVNGLNLGFAGTDELMVLRP